MTNTRSINTDSFRAIALPRVPEHSAPVAYRRRRLVAGLGLSLVVLLGGLGVASASGSDRGVEHPPLVHVVQPGDTLWSIARSLQPHGDIRRLVHALAEQNGGADLSIGSQIALP